MNKLRNLLDNFYQFAMQGNMIDMAVGIIIGGAFSTVVKSLVDDIIMPPIGLLIGDVDFKDLYIVLKQGSESLPAGATMAAAQEAGAVTWNYGLFINNIISFLILALAVFFVVQSVNQFRKSFEKKEKEVEEITEKACSFCTLSIPIQATRCPHCTSELSST